jgi:hypothetical protein
LPSCRILSRPQPPDENSAFIDEITLNGGRVIALMKQSGLIFDSCSAASYGQNALSLAAFSHVVDIGEVARARFSAARSPQVAGVYKNTAADDMEIDLC